MRDHGLRDDNTNEVPDERQVFERWSEYRKSFGLDESSTSVEDFNYRVKSKELGRLLKSNRGDVAGAGSVIYDALNEHYNTFAREFEAVQKTYIDINGSTNGYEMHQLALLTMRFDNNELSSIMEI